MAATFLLLLLLLLGVTQAVTPPPCQGDPTSWCWDTAMATRCGWEQQCQDLRDSLALGNVAGGDDVADGDGVADGDSVADGDGVADGDSVAEGDSVAKGRKIKCSLCTKALKKIQKLAGDDPDEAKVEAALHRGCRVLGRVVGRLCQRLVSKYQGKISEGLQNGDTPRDICTAIGICRS